MEQHVNLSKYITSRKKKSRFRNNIFLRIGPGAGSHKIGAGPDHIMDVVSGSTVFFFSLLLSLRFRGTLFFNLLYDQENRNWIRNSWLREPDPIPK
jgi:hypothetical protein